MPISTEGSSLPTMRPQTGYPVYGLGAGGTKDKGTVGNKPEGPKICGWGVGGAGFGHVYGGKGRIFMRMR